MIAFVLVTQCCLAADWTQFRGSGGAGISTDSTLPLTWNDSENLKWKAELPGAGSSSPIVLGNRIFVTSYSGYGVPKENGGDVKSLRRHLTSVSRTDGKIVWTKTVPGLLPEDNYQGYISEHGYASNTPVTDGERIYCFFGKSGVVGFDLDGNQLWQTEVGKESSNRRWGSAASLILYKDYVIVNASEESQSIRALDKKTGKEIWKASGAALELAYGTPSLITLNEGRTDLVIAVPGEIWGLNPDTGKIRWFEEHQLTGNICPSIVADKETVFVYASPVLAKGSIYVPTRWNGVLVLPAKPQYQVLAQNKFNDESDFNATPAISQDELFLRSNRFLYCVAIQKK